jgi:glycosyltransferase involved in cell wall biosynthesis
MEAATVTGAAKSMFDFCRAAQARPEETPVETSIITYFRGPASRIESNEFVRAGRDLGLDFDLVGERFRFDPRTLDALRQIVEKREPDLVLTHHVKSHFLMRLSGLHRRFPWIAYHHGYTSTDLKMLAYNRLDRWSLPTADRVVTVCEAFAHELATMRAVPREKIFVQHNSIMAGRRVADEEIRTLKQQLGYRDGEQVLLAVGRLSREKAHADLLRAVALLARTSSSIRNLRVVIVGEGPEGGALKHLARQLGISDHVVFAGQTSDVAPFYAAADVFVLPSHSEGSPYVLLEAMAAGVPVVATAVGGVPEIVTNEESALLVAPRNEAAMAGALERVLSEPELARSLAAQALALASTRFAPETQLRSLMRLYRELADLR